jgi:hypothetical protein
MNITNDNANNANDIDTPNNTNDNAIDIDTPNNTNDNTNYGPTYFMPSLQSRKFFRRESG